MITAAMKLNTTRDARQWAGDILSGISSSDYDYDRAVDLLSDWLWDEKPEIGCLYSEHPIDGMDEIEFWAIIADAERS